MTFEERLALLNERYFNYITKKNEINGLECV